MSIKDVNMRYSILFPILLMLTVATSTAAERQKICASCQRPITGGQYVEAEGRFWHPEHFVCAYCGRPLGTAHYYTANGLRYDSACYADEISARCAYCGKPVGNNWVTYDGRDYHQECYENAVALRCSFCGEIIDGNYLRDQWGNAYHEYHRSEPRCQYCGRLFTEATNGGEKFSDGRSECGLCLETAIRTKPEAEVILREVKAALAGTGITIDEDDLPVKLVGEGDLRGIHGQEKGDLELEGVTQWEKRSWLFGMVNRYDFDIYILHSLPRMHYYATVAHELMHVWLTLNAPINQNSAMVEGTCNYASYLVLKQMGGSDAERIIDRMLSSSDPDYGEGFRQVTAQVELLSLPGWLEYLRKNENPPW